MSRSFFVTALVAGLLGYFAGNQPWTSADTSAHIASTGYVCPMHAAIVTDTAGSCPVCGMDLVMQESGATNDPQAGLPVVSVPPSVVHNLGVRTATVELGDLQRSIETIGKITRVDPMARRTITPPIRGELLYIADKQASDLVTAGELLFSIASEELYEHQEAFQDAYQSGDRATANAMIPALSEMGLTSEQIAGLQAGDEPRMPVEVHAFEDGFIYTRRGRVGEQAHTGFTVFNVGGNYRVIEITAEIFEQQWSWVKEGQLARMTVRGLPGVVFEGQVVRVEPPVGYTTRSLEVGLQFKTDNPQLSQSMFAHVSIVGQPLRNVLLVPTDTVIRTGQGDRVVVVRGENNFQPLPVIAGEEAGGMIEIRSGLQPGDKVVASGQFLIDSESSLRAGLRRLATPGVDQQEHAHKHRHTEPSHAEPVDRALEQGSQAGRVSHDVNPEPGYRQVTYTPVTRH
ncbi:MAG: HlyD family efflux transporter periplasmic adaptor subunit [Thermotogales bacterium]|nr:HlyD family efflux transporter periplasmic adaptor subunit [Thermotogales bacterium]